MTHPTLQSLFDTLDATWPAAGYHRAGPWLVREGKGGGKRVSCASAVEPVSDADIPLAEEAHRALGQTPLFMIRPGEEALDAALEARGYRIVDPVDLRAAPVPAFPAPDPMRAFAHWPPLALSCDLWDETGIGPERQAVMHRVAGPRAALLGRAPEELNRAAGAGFVALHGDIAMLHALEILPELRRQGSAHQMLCAAARWAQGEGATWLTLAVTRTNEGAGKLYASLGMGVVGQYHYRSA